MRLPYILLLLLITINSKAQNLVPNGNFEQYTNCPTGLSQVTNYCTGWREYTAATPDYFNTCSISGVPVNFQGYQFPANGNAYTGVAIFSGSAIWKEYIATQIPSLQIGGVYEVSMSISLANNSKYGSDDLGVFFYDSGPYTLPSTTTLIPFTPQVSYSNYGPITDTQNWVRISKTFVADSAYDNIIIGGFKDWSTIDTQRIQNNGFVCYYYIDSVVIKLFDSLSFSYNDTLLCAGDSLIVPFSASSGLFSSNNVFTLQLSNAAGSFANPITIASLTTKTSGVLRGVVPNNISSGVGYRLRIISSSSTIVANSTKNIAIGMAKPAKPFAGGNNLICAGDTLSLTATCTTTGVNWHWSGPNFTSTTQNPVVPNFGATNGGDYVVTALNYGCEDKDTITVAYQPPLTTVNASNSGPICAGASVNFTTTSSNSGATYSWTGPNNLTSNLQNFTLSGTALNMSGDYVVVAILNGCTTSDTTSLIVKPIPVSSASNNGSICEDDILNLTATSTLAGSTFTWSGPASFTSVLQNPSISPAKPANLGNYTVIATKDGCSSLPATTLAVIYPTPATPVPSANSIMCDASPLNLSTAYVPNAVYHWTGPNGFTSNLQNPTINPATFINAGYYTLRISTNGCFSKKDSVNVTVNIIPRIGGYASPNDTICEGTLTTFVAKYNSGGNKPVFQWYKNYNPVAGANTLLYTTNKLVTGDIFYCTMYTVGVCTDPITVSTDTISMVVLPIVTQPSATITSVPSVPQPSEPVTFTAHVTNGGPLPKYQWQLNSVDQIGATYATWSAATLRPFDKVNVIITSNDPCATNKVASSDTITVGFTTAVNDVNKGKQFNVYPNPNNGNFRITAGNISAQSVKLELVNTIGQVVYRNQLQVVNSSIDQDIRLNDVSPGIYLLKVYDGDHVNTVKLTIK